jgi:hypothetical protein
MMKIRSFFVSLARKIGFVAVIAALILALGFLIALPLWFMATKNPGLYNILFLSLAGACAVFFIVRKALRPKNH